MALVLLRGSAGDPKFVLVLAGMLALVAGSVHVRQLFAQPLYSVYLAWKVQPPPEGWQRARDRYFRQNVVRDLGPKAVFVLF